MNSESRILVAGHRGMVGSAVVRQLRNSGFEHLICAGREELDYTCQKEVDEFFQEHRPHVAIIAAARVGGIGANSTYPAEFLYENLMIAANCINAAYRSGVDRVVFLGSSCIYPKRSPQPIPERALLTSDLEPTNEAYAIAKIAGLKLCQHYNSQYGTHYVSLMPTNIYGPGDNYGLENSHVLPALIHKIHTATVQKAPSVEIWGDGTPLREFLHVDDLARAIVFIAGIDYERLNGLPAWLNVGSGVEVSISDLAKLIGEVAGFGGTYRFDESKPNGMPRKLLDSGIICGLGWRPLIELRDGIAGTYRSFLKELEEGTIRLK